MATFADRFKQLRNHIGWSQQRLADELSISKSSVNMYERGEREPSFEVMESIADLFNVDMDYLYGRADVKNSSPISIPKGFSPMPAMTPVPLVGTIACGTPILAEENIDEIVSLPSAWHATFSLVCKGDSMFPLIHDGDLVAIRQQPTVENGEIAAVRIENEATLKRVYISDGNMVLQPVNQSYPPIVLVGQEMNKIKIEGKAVGFCRGL